MPVKTRIVQQRMRRRHFLLIRNERGQSVVEYLVVTAALVASLIAVPSIYKEISSTLQNKYQSYAFGIAVSDPPSKAFDDRVKKDADEVKKVIGLLKDIAQYLEDLGNIGNLEKIWDDIKNL